ncbi:response regulator receiver protein [Paraglaciecola sp. T6c]|uniref:response regulator transcription factor n=1 Tax=Pseudoalteromonas atlantica (strain T6c / ATCC BAA-1087) TaxID=3042615 RepID=UPI00005C53CE|nr:response regulator [Paraglaciecola sp. T6c]ABG40613.1 response regulator receiver protein [Paraglaciecola sp. T6c]
MISTLVTKNHHPIIYLVDHQKDARAALSKLLSPLDVTIQCFASAESFMRQQISDDAIGMIIEAHLEDKKDSGIELLETLVKRGFHLPTIVMASSSDIPTAVRAMRASAADFIEKPFIEHVLVHDVQQIINGAKPH